MNNLMTKEAAPIMRSPELIAAEINSIKAQTRKLVLYNSIEIGRRLVEAKSLINHGEWGDWLEKSVEYSKSTANNLMRIFEEYGADQITLLEDNAKSQALGNLSYTQAVVLLGVPEEEREQFVKEHDLDSMSTRELQEAIRERDQARKEIEDTLKKLENANKVANEKSEEARKLQEDKQQLESNIWSSNEALKVSLADVQKLQDALKKERDDNKKEVSKLEKSIYELKKQVSSAEESGDSQAVAQMQEALGEAEKELEAAAKRINELEKQLKEAPLEVAAPVEKVPEEIERELQELRGSKVTTKYKVYFNSLVETFDNLLKALAEMESADPDTHVKFKKATCGLIEKMRERL